MDKPLILLVEDNPDDEELTLFAFRKAEVFCDVAVVHDGAEAVEYISQNDRFASNYKKLPSLIVLDLKLPKLDGIEVLGSLRKLGITRFTPVVILTSSKEDNDILKSYKYGANSYVNKPIDFSEFCDLIQKIANYWLFINESYQYKGEHI